MRNRLLVAGATCALAVMLVGCSTSAATPSSGGGGSQITGPVSSSGSAPASQPPASTGGQGGGGTKAVPDPCSLLTQAQVAGVVAVAVGPAKEESHTCSFTYQDPTKVLDQVAASVSDNIQVSQITKDCQAPSGHGITITSVSGVGDVACFVDAGILGAHITFASGGLGFEVSVLAFGSLQAQYATATAEGMEKALALDVIAAL